MLIPGIQLDWKTEGAKTQKLDVKVRIKYIKEQEVSCHLF